MFCKKCGQSLPEGSGICTKCGTKMNNPSNLYTSPNVHNPAVVSDKKKNKFILVTVIAVITIVVMITAVFSGGSTKSGKESAESYLKACHEEDVNKMISLVPNSVIKEITKEYGCSKNELKEAVKEEISYWSERLSHNNGDILDSYKTENIEKYKYEDYFDRRVEMCIDYDKISSIDIYRVSLKNDYYYDIPVYKYNGKWYVTDAATFVAYAVWERH